ncbi:cysteine proteinase inhibitor 12-like [Vitis riparia]|uniref:cysteine proteinase inhibitor 12-like n=1 Tax=Vitis riparia TaxID=96939 RepID=UPI00155B1341|nr:cysteine proteinase inhibitor 12-like [Vitis riparia]
MELNRLVILSLSFVLVSQIGFCREDSFIRMPKTMNLLGGVRDCGGIQNSAEIESIARFAVQEHNKNQNALLEFAKVLKAKEQVVASKIYYLTLEAIDAGKKKIYEAKVWVKPWMNFKELQEFKHAQETKSFTSSDLGVKQDGHGSEWQVVPTNDPEVQDAANHVVKSIQMRSNSIFRYELLEILLAKAKVIEGSAKFDLLLKLKWGSKDVKFKAEVNKNIEGKFCSTQWKEDHL